MLSYILQLGVSRRQIILLLFGFSSGLPLALSGATLQAWFADASVDIKTIGWLTLASQPYVYKIFWAPLLDKIALPLGRRRGWIFAMQASLALFFVLMATQDPKISPMFLGFLAFLVAFCSATQDMAVDAYRTEILPEAERGLGSAMFVSGYRIAMLISGGLALVVAGLWGWRSTYGVMALYMLCMGLVTLFAPPAPSEIQPQVKSTWREALGPFLQHQSIAAILLFVVLYKLGDAFTLSLSSAFLLKGLHFTLIDVGAVYKTIGMGATLAGAFVGGLLMTRIRMFTALWYFGILQAVSSAMFMWLAIAGKSYVLMVVTIFLESFCGGLATVAFMAFLMSLCDSAFTATQYALLSALSAIGRVYVGPVAGYMVSNLGWVWFYFWSVMIAIPGMLLLWLLRRNKVFYTKIKGENE